MKRKFLEDLGIDKETADKILDENSSDIGKAKGELDTVKSSLETANSEIEGLKGQVKERDTQLQQLKDSTGDIESLKEQIETLQTENKTKDETHKAEMKQLKIDTAIASALTAAKAKNLVAAKALLKLEGVDLEEDGSVKGLAEQIKKLQSADDSKFLFETENKKQSFKGVNPGESGNEEGDLEVDTTKMTYEELAAYMEANPDAKIN